MLSLLSYKSLFIFLTQNQNNQFPPKTPINKLRFITPIQHSSFESAHFFAHISVHSIHKNHYIVRAESNRQVDLVEQLTVGACEMQVNVHRCIARRRPSGASSECHTQSCRFPMPRSTCKSIHPF